MQELSNDNSEELNIEKLRTFKGFEKVTEEEGNKIIESIKEFTMIVYECFMNTVKRKKKNHENDRKNE